MSTRNGRSANIRDLAARWAPVPLRLLVGYGFIMHGYAKLARGTAGFAAVLHALLVPLPDLMARLTIGIELLGGLAVFLGAIIPLAAVPLSAVLLVAMFTVHLRYGFSSIKLLAVTSAGPQFGPPGYETDLLYLAALLTLCAAGPGPFAFDRRRFRTGRNSAQLAATNSR